MAGRWRDPARLFRAPGKAAPASHSARSGFRADPNAPAAARPTRRQAAALLAVLVLAAGVVAVLSYAIRPERARAFDLFHGSVYLSDELGPVAVDLATGKPTLQLADANRQIGLREKALLDTVVPLSDETLLLNPTTGEFNMVDNNGFIVKHDGNGGVMLGSGEPTGPTKAAGIDAGSGQAYIVRTGPDIGTEVYLVNQSTVESAINVVGHVQTRATGRMDEPGSTDPGGAASANGDLWMLVGGSGTGGTRIIRQLQVPPDSSAGATLLAFDHSPVTGPAAISTAATGADGAGAVGVASVSRIDVWAAGSTAPTPTYQASYQAPAGVETVLPVSNESDRLAFLIKARAGWYLVSVGADGTDLRVPTLLPDLPHDAELAPPAASEGRLYTVDRSSGDLYQIDYDGTVRSLPGQAEYPANHSESRDFGDTYVFARGPRVAFDSPSHDSALVFFTDGTNPPRRVFKRHVVRLDIAAVPALTRSNVPAGPPKSSRPGTEKPQPVKVQPVNPGINCHTTAVTPHIPVVNTPLPGSRSVALSWRYPVFSPVDCVPSTYIVTITTSNSDAPDPPAPLRVVGQTGRTVVGLYPSTHYQVVVTALINGRATDSDPTTFTTGDEGPPAPKNVTVLADSSGNWQLNWDSCGSVADGCVPAQSWTITPSFCDRRGVSEPPAPITQTADQSAVHQPTQIYHGSDDLLGRGLRFQIQGTGTEGQPGIPSAPSACVFSWANPVAADLAVQASTPPQTAGSNDTTTTTARVTFAGGRVHDLGGVGGTLTYQLLAGGTVVDSVGPTQHASVTLTGIRAAVRYQVLVLASPPQHPEVTVPIGPVDVVPAIAAWPDVQIDQPTFDAPPGLSGTLHVHFAFPAGTDTRGETFDLVNSQLTCGGGNTAMNLTASDVAPGDDLTFQVDRTIYRGPCTVTLALAQDPRTVTDPPLYGAGTSSARTSPQFQIDPPSITSTSSDFQAQWAGTNGNPTVVVSYHGADDLSGARNWQITLNRGSDTCGTTSDAPPATITVNKDCVARGDGNYSVHIEYDYFVVAHAAFDVPVSGDAPSPIDPSKLSFTAQWNDNPDAPQVLVDYTGTEPAGALAALDWTEVVTSSASPGVACVTEHEDPGAATLRISDVLTTCPATLQPDGELPTYSVELSFTDPNYGRSGDYPTPVTGTPPQ